MYPPQQRSRLGTRGIPPLREGRRAQTSATLRLLFCIGLAATGATVTLHAAEDALPELKFESPKEYRLLAHSQLKNDRTPDSGHRYPAGSTHVFGRLEVSGDGAADAEFAVAELPDSDDYEVCLSYSETCHEVEIRVRPDGLLYLGIDIEHAHARNSRLQVQTNDFTTQRVGASATLPSGLQVHTELLVRPPGKAPDCGDYPDDDIDRFGCLFGGELLPALPDRLDEPTLIDGLPDKLTQPKSNYELVFYEEFSGDRDNNGTTPLCAHGSPEVTDDALDPDIWNYKHGSCDRVDSGNRPLQTVEDGHYQYTFAKGQEHFSVGISIGTEGKFAFKYGYLELKYTVDLARANKYVNTPFRMGDYQPTSLHSHRRYGIETTSLEEFLRYRELEINLFEYVQSSRRAVSHQYLNWPARVNTNYVPSMRTNKAYRYCNAASLDGSISFYLDDDGCDAPGATLTITKGFEWTPRGYRTFYKVEDLHDEFHVLPKENIIVEQRYKGDGAAFTFIGSARDPYFEYVDATDENTVLEQLGVAHMPHVLTHRGLGWQSTARVYMKVDYFRVFQPVDRYAGMEPVFQ